MKLFKWGVVLMFYTIFACLMSCMANRAFAQCPDPILSFQDNYRGDFRYTIFSWTNPTNCNFFIEGTRQTNPDPFGDTNALWFTLEPTYTFRSYTFSNGMYRISPVTKRVIIDMEDFSEPGNDDGSPFAPQCWFVRPKLYNR